MSLMILDLVVIWMALDAGLGFGSGCGLELELVEDLDLVLDPELAMKN